jgi:hypothetical protein
VYVYVASVYFDIDQSVGCECHFTFDPFLSFETESRWDILNVLISTLHCIVLHFSEQQQQQQQQQQILLLSRIKESQKKKKNKVK